MHTDGVTFPPIRRLGPDDLGACAALSVDRGWSPERAKWSLLLAAAEPFGVDAPDRRGLAGAVVLTRWGPDLASVGMMLVAARYARLGLGRALMEHVLAEAAGATVTLFATDMGRPLYENLGFMPVRRNVSFRGRFRGRPEDNSNKPASRLAAEEDLPAIFEVDKAAFGADRSHILRWLPTFADHIRVVTAESGITGYGAAWRPDVTSTVFGPVVAPSAAVAKQLITDLAGHARTPVRLDLDPDRPELPGWAAARGLEPVSRAVVMAHGDLPPRGTPDRLFTPISVALA